jgi:NAD(P)-dependent dehydrogenase (short-subunit alcohol dehydrogenase family)
MSLKGLHGKVAVVTGAARGIGAATVERLLSEGCRVVASDISADGLRRYAGRAGVATALAEISDADHCDAAAACATDTFGSLDLLAHCAGIFAAVHPVAEMDVEAFDRVFAVNVRGTMLMMRACLRQMIRQQRGGAIVSVASVSSFRTGRERAAYSASKRAVLGIAAAAAIENGQHGIRVNSVAPGSIDTEMMRGSGALRESIMVNQLATPLQRMGQPEEISALIAWLLSDEASLVTGGVYVADGGFLA